ncbi:MAG TPA: MBL fold metallo-hydrolase [Cyclobacteriaceae bacterium]|nr:MBL fold metallo-hydrolase [Cyclobacteriaceae bacterium]
MKAKTLISIALGFIIPLAWAQKDAPDSIETSAGILSIQPVLHATMALSWNGKTIYIDPYGGATVFEGMAAPDLILITDNHGDHMNIPTLNAINTEKSVILAPQAVKDELPENLQSKTVALANHEITTQLGIKITALPMYNLPERADSRHPKGRGNGYVLALGGKNIYISGDTEDIPEMRALKNIDIAFVCMNQPFTMTVEQAASAVLEFKPKIVYPFHYRGREGLSDVEAFKKMVNDKDAGIEVRLKNWYPQ